MKWLCCVCLLFVSGGMLRANPVAEIVSASGIRGGLLVHIGCGDGRATAELRVNDHFLVHGLDSDPAKVAEARRHISRLGRYGKVAVDSLDNRNLPYMDNLVNLILILDPNAVCQWMS